MDSKDIYRLRKIMTQAKTGGHVSNDDQDFLQECWKNNRFEYIEIKNDVDSECIRRVNPLAK
jgi:hypothetical protein